MPGKGLGAALLLTLCLLVGCGGGGGESSSTSPEGSEGPAAQAPQSADEAAAQLHQSAERIERQRQGQQAEASGETRSAKSEEGQSQGEGQDKATPPPPPVQPISTHHDSGGGTAQFATKSGDNSIQKSGHEAGAPETQAAAAVLHAYLDARVAHRWGDACFYLSAGFAATIEAFAERYAKGKEVKGCAEVLEGFASGSSQQALVATARADVGALRIEGDHGFVLYHGAGGVPYAMPMALEGGDWKVGSLEGAPLG